MPRSRKPAIPFRYFNSSPEVIRLAVMMYVRFPLSLRNVEDLLIERGIDLCHETVWMWRNRFGPMFAGDIRRQRVSRMRCFRQWRWHLDEMYVKFNGEILESYITRARDTEAALTFMKMALKRHGSPETITSDGLRSYRAAINTLGNAEKQEIGRWANNRVENSHLSFRRRECAMLRFRRMKTLQKFALVHANVHNLLASPPFGSTRNASSSIARPTSSAARPHWPSGRASWPKPSQPKPELR